MSFDVGFSKRPCIEPLVYQATIEHEGTTQRSGGEDQLRGGEVGVETL
jgi:hypothetical protein